MATSPLKPEFTSPAPAVQWRGNTPYSPRFQDIYRSSGLDGCGGIDQAKQVFLHACKLPQAWHNQAHFTILEAGFGLGLNFLCTWLAWENDAQACQHLHFVSIEAYPVQASDILHALHALRSHPECPRLSALAQTLIDQYWGLTPGLHRLRFAQNRVHLTLCIGEIASVLPSLQLQANAVFLDGFSPSRNPQMWQKPVLQAIARLCAHHAWLGTYSVAKNVCEALASVGFVCTKVKGLAPKRHSLQAVYAPQKTTHSVSRSAPDNTLQGANVYPLLRQRRCIVVGAGIAGAACACTLALRGWQVTLLDQAASPAAHASAVPVALFAPRVSADDNPTSRLLRAGQRLLLHYLQAKRNLVWPQPLQHGQDWALSGVATLQQKSHVLEKYRALLATQPWYADWSKFGGHWETPYLQHPHAGWVKPKALVQAWLAHPKLRFVGNTRIQDLKPLRSSCDLIVLANSVDAALLCPYPLPLLRPIRGQMSLGRVSDLDQRFNLSQPVNGHGHIVPAVPDSNAMLWATGATFTRDQRSTATQAQDDQVNIARVAHLYPAAYPALRKALERGQTQAWAGVRCYTPDRLPLVGVLPDTKASAKRQAPVALCTGLGAHGISLAPLCAELLSAQLHGEPWPLERKLAEKLNATRFVPAENHAQNTKV